MGAKHVLGIDIGGTKVAAGLVNGSGEIVSIARAPMNANGSAEDAMRSVQEAIAGVFPDAKGREVFGVGVASPGPLDPICGLVLHSPNLACWRDFPLTSSVQAICGIPTRLDNDANAGGLAEALWGAGAGYRHVFYITIGTGIGTALVYDGHLYHGRTGNAPEGGHQTIDIHAPVRCGCGKRGCIEGLASGPAIAEQARALAVEDPSAARALLAAAGNRPDGITPEVLFRCWHAGDPFSTRLVDGTVELLAVWLGNLIDLFEPDIFIVGGGVGMGLQPAYDRLRTAAARWSLNGRAAEIPMAPARYGVDAGIAGSAALWFQDTPADVAIDVTPSVP
ncbi:MAG TPA: ROK family protein [Terriglobales bacterium]|nr:ROK family protein [Terriglobales bacterium]